MVQVDPTNEPRPDYTLPEHQAARDGLVAALFANDPEPQARAITALETMWDTEHLRRVEEWNAQQPEQNDNPPDPPANPNPPPQNPLPPPAPTPATSKIPVLVEDMPFPDIPYTRISSFAAQKCRAYEFVELWYWTPEACQEAAVSYRSGREDTIGLVLDESGTGATLQRVMKGSTKAIPDEQLSWTQILAAKGHFLNDIKNSFDWPVNLQHSFSRFYFNLDTHPDRDIPFGQETLIAYHARARHEWHDAFKRSTTGQVFNIHIIDERVFKQLFAEAQSKAFSNQSTYSSLPSDTNLTRLFFITHLLPVPHLHKYFTHLHYIFLYTAYSRAPRE
jgi:hypothetical protein